MSVLDFIGLVATTIIFVWSSLFEKVRAIYPKMLKCAMCCGFWIGLGGSLIRRGLYADRLDHFYTATAVSLLSFATFLILERIELPLIKKNQ